MRRVLLVALLVGIPSIAVEVRGEDVEVSADGSVTSKSKQLDVVFVNLSPHTASLYWDDGRYGKLISASIAADGGAQKINTHAGHEFFWTWEGSRESIGSSELMRADQLRYELPADSQRNEAGAGDEDACKDRYPKQCPRDAERGECQTNPGWMAVNCPLACDYCELLDPATRCSRARLNMTETPFLQPGDLDALMERVLVNFPELGPRAVSSPADGNPWVIIFDNFIKDDEIEALISNAGNGDGFARSTDTGPANTRGEVKKIVSTSRTSENAWCTRACDKNPLVQRVTERINQVTGVPVVNYEQFQVLRYVEGQYYKPHHDAGPASFKLACGPRILTFFLYLSDVEEGGGTRFPKIESADGSGPLVVVPRKGQAVVWPSVLSDDPGRIDQRTTHEAMPVVKGTKFAANHWIHSYNFRVPNHWGCTGAFD